MDGGLALNTPRSHSETSKTLDSSAIIGERELGQTDPETRIS